MALSRGILKRKKGKSTINFNGDSMNTEELFFQTIHLSVFGAVANWCHQFGLTEEEKGRASNPADNKFLQLENRMRENVLSFEAVARKIQLTQLCARTYFQYLVAAWKQHKIRRW